MNKHNALVSLRSGAEFVIKDGVLEWLDTEQSQPTDTEIDAEIIRLQAEFSALQYQRDRQYPSTGEQLDMLFHDMSAGKGTKTGEWYKAIAKIKSDNSKPE
jgi:hypothetical protein